jgi:predicted nuclease of predicted toxin-antitoxin system
MAGRAGRYQSLRLLLDEMLSPQIAVQLRSRGHDVRAVREYPSESPLSDGEVTDRARSERRAVVSNNVRDFRLLHAAAILPGGPGHFGIVFMSSNYRRTRADTGRVVAVLEAKLTEYPVDTDVANAEVWL